MDIDSSQESECEYEILRRKNIEEKNKFLIAHGFKPKQTTIPPVPTKKRTAIPMPAIPRLDTGEEPPPKSSKVEEDVKENDIPAPKPIQPQISTSNERRSLRPRKNISYREELAPNRDDYLCKKIEFYMYIPEPGEIILDSKSNF